jgi:DUF2911 family protein
MQLTRLGIASAVLLAFAPACGGGSDPETSPAPQPQAESGGFVVTLGADTVAVERYTRAGDRLTGELVNRTPSTVVRSYTATLRPDGSISRFEMTARTPGGTAPATVTTFEFTGDSAVTRVQRGDSVRTFRAAGVRPLPLLNPSMALNEQALLHARAVGGPEVDMTLVPAGNQTYAMKVAWAGADSARLTNVAGLNRVAVDAQGRLLGLNGLESTQKFIVTRVPAVEAEALALEFTRRDAAGRGVGALSPRDSAVADVGGAHVAIDYGRPFRRGRKIMGEVVPWGQVWRTGANAATGFRTTRDLEIGGVTVPAGAYTLWTLPTQAGWKLIVNRQTGQWGTEYHPEQDLARIDMQTRPVSPPVEQFTIRLETTGGNGGVLRLAWDDTEAFVPFTVK